MADSNGTSRRRRPTVADVAREAGVSVSTTARALGHYGYVSDDVRKSVEQAAEKLSYRPNSVARAMRAGETRTLAYVCADIENPFFSAVMRGIADVAHAAGYETLLFNSDESTEVESAALRVLMEKLVDGAIVVPASVRSYDHLQSAIEQGTPMVLVDRRIEGLATDAVVADNGHAAEVAVQHLVALGHTRIGILAQSSSVDVFAGVKSRKGRLTVAGPRRPVAERISGYLSALSAAGLAHDADLIHWYVAGQDPTEAVEALIAAAPTAVFCTDDAATKVLHRALRRHRIRVPQGMSVVGFDDLEWTEIVDPPLTVVAQPAYEMGEEAARLLLARLDDGVAPPTTTTLRTRLIERQSTAPARQ